MLPSAIAASDKILDVTAKLNEAKSYIRVKPSKSLALLQEHHSQLPSLTPEQQVLWQLLIVGASQQLHRLQQAEPALEYLLTLKQTPAFRHKMTAITSAFGSWFIRSGFAEAAKLCFLCALQHSKVRRQQLGILSNLAAVYRELGQQEQAIEMIQMALRISSQTQDQLYAAIIQNNLGLLYLDGNQYELAAKHFLAALNQNQKIMRHSGQIRSGSNLLLTYLYARQQQNYLRLLPRVQRLFKQETHISKKAYLTLLTSTYAQQQGKVFSAKQKQNLQQTYLALDDLALQKTLIPLAKELQLVLTSIEQKSLKQYAGNWLTQIPGCDWKTYQQADYLPQLAKSLTAITQSQSKDIPSPTP